MNIRRRLFGISPEEATFKRRRFPACEAAARERLETIGRTFLEGYHAALEQRRTPGLVSVLESIELERRGFAYEGAAMALGLMDMLLPWRRDRFRTFLTGPAHNHAYMSYVGYGWALARLGRRPESLLAGADPLIKWLALDGYGFHETYFGWEKVVVDQRIPARLRGYALRAFDQGVGRCLWFVGGADPERVANAIMGFAAPRRSDLWSGVGLAAAYAGGASEADLYALRYLGRDYHREMAQGVLFATETRVQAGNMALHTEVACDIIAGITVPEASAIVNGERRDLPYDDQQPAYEIWRRRIGAYFGSEKLLATAHRGASGRGSVITHPRSV